MMLAFFYVLVRIRNGVEEKLCGSLDIDKVIDVMKSCIHGYAVNEAPPLPSFRIESVEVLP